MVNDESQLDSRRNSDGGGEDVRSPGRARRIILAVLLLAGATLALTTSIHDVERRLRVDVRHRWSLAWREDEASRRRRTLRAASQRVTNGELPSADVFGHIHDLLVTEAPDEAIIALDIPQSVTNVLDVRRLQALIYPRRTTWFSDVAKKFVAEPERVDENVFVIKVDPSKTFPTQEFFDLVATLEGVELWRYRGTE